VAEKKSRFLRIVLPVLVLVLAVGAAVLLVLSRPKPERQAPAAKGVLVEVEQVKLRPHRLKVRAQGTVEPVRTVEVQPRVSGRIVGLHAHLTPGGLIGEDQSILQLEKRDYELAVRNGRTALARAESELALEEGRQRTAELEWRMFGDKNSDTGQKDLALRGPQLKAAKGEVEAARVRLDQAELDLERTELRAPFSAIVLEENAALGRLLNPQTVVATLVATDRFRIRAAVPVAKLPPIAIPGINAEKGSAAVVRHDMGEGQVEKEGRVVRLLPDIEPAGRMARLLIEVEDPLNLAADDSGEAARGMPLLLGAYVDVEIEVPGQPELIEVPRQAVHDGDLVYIYTVDKTLVIRRVHIVWRRPDTVLVDRGLEDGERIVISPLAAPVEGMRLRLGGDGDDAGNGEPR